MRAVGVKHGKACICNAELRAGRVRHLKLLNVGMLLRAGMVNIMTSMACGFEFAYGTENRASRWHMCVCAHLHY